VAQSIVVGFFLVVLAGGVALLARMVLGHADAIADAIEGRVAPFSRPAAPSRAARAAF
jgi:hypothetical protein